MTSIQKKGDIIINPQTSRPVKVGSRTWLKLVREGIVEGKYSDPNEIYTIQEGDDVDAKIEEFNKTLPSNIQSVRGRGKYANKIVKRHRQPSTTETSRYTVKKTASKIKNREIYEDLQEGGNFEEDLEALIMAELTNMNNTNENDDDYEYEIKGDENEEEYEEEYEEDEEEYEGNYEGNYEENYEEDEGNYEEFSEGSFE